MGWTFNQSNGELRKDGILVGHAYSGSGDGKNNPQYEAVRDVGPIPGGFWEFAGPPFDTTEHGPYCLRIEPGKGTETYGRVGFLLHGDSSEHPGCASKGCIVISPRQKRSYIWQSGDVKLEVIHGLTFPDVGGEISV